VRRCWAIGQSHPTTARNLLITGKEFGAGPPRCSEAQALVWQEKLRARVFFSLKSGRAQESHDRLSVPVQSLHEDGASLVTMVLGRRITDNSKMWNKERFRIEKRKVLLSTRASNIQTFQ